MADIDVVSHVDEVILKTTMALAMELVIIGGGHRSSCLNSMLPGGRAMVC